MKFKRNGIREAGFQFSEEAVIVLRTEWQNFAKKITRYPKKFSGKGVVYTAGGVKYITCAWVSISLLRNSGCSLPIELWYLGNELSKGIIGAFSGLDVEFRNFLELGRTDFTGFMLKPLAIINSRFAEILFLDADNNCVSNPEYLFSLPSYKSYGCIFWPDYFRTSKNNSMWNIVDVKSDDLPEQESGQILINKEQCWKELQLCLYFNKYSEFYYRILYGDKDTFRFAWLALKSNFYMIEHPAGSCGYKRNEIFYGHTMVQHDNEGKILFLHRNLLKWDITKRGEICWEVIKEFKNNSKKRVITITSAPTGWGVNLLGDVYEIDFNACFNNYESICLHFLSQWRDSKEYKTFLEFSYFAKYRRDLDSDFIP